MAPEARCSAGRQGVVAFLVIQADGSRRSCQRIRTRRWPDIR